MSQLTTHVLDTSKGKPAEGINVYLYHRRGADWEEVTAAHTDSDGRIPDLLRKEVVLTPGDYKLRFETKDYFDRQVIATFYPFIEICFTITGNEHYHVPLLLNPFGYSTYRGS